MPAFKRSDLTTAIVKYLGSFEKDTQIIYNDLSKAVGARIGPLSHHLIYARKILEREQNAVWVPVKPKIGVRRLKDNEIAERLPRWWMRGARSKLRRGGNQADTVELSELDINQQTRFSVDCIQRELAFDSLSKATRNRMEKVARGTSNDLPKFNIIEWAITLSPRRKQESAE